MEIFCSTTGLVPILDPKQYSILKELYFRTSLREPRVVALELVGLVVVCSQLADLHKYKSKAA